MQSCWDKACPLLQVLSSAVTSAENAGRLIRRTRGQDMDILEKGYRDLQTKADRFSEISIVSSLRMKFETNLKIIAEEGLTVDSDVPASFIESGVCNDVLALEDQLDAQLKKASINEAIGFYDFINCFQFTVWIDPLDGTYEFAHGLLSHATIMIGISLSAKPVAGVIHQPFVSDVDTLDDVGRTVWAVKSVDRIFGDLQVKPPPNGKRIVVTTRSHGNPNLENILEILQPTEVIRVGGAGNKVLMLIEGEAHAYVFPGTGTKKWDTCAAECILSAAGGRMTDLCGNEIDYSSDVNVNNLQGILATAPTVDHEKYASFSNQNL
ncbi:3'(2'),5'-bisphosphate nucleotidase 1 [Trichinella spiralis]|uniref:3'(2'),5'-bisphosphate nucleotidase 1 n=1 Tax=Trichinella spiralis TaxID=6334 RepID=A0A0V1B815_TRISP|nr:3'(2'),5'-bisphosphate nucleotidase 1 [Trichinella spiralis]